MRNLCLTTSLAVTALAVAAEAQGRVLVTRDITTSTTWTSNNIYDLQRQVYVLPGATLTIQAGTVVSSTANGSLAVTNGARIIVQGTERAPVVMTSEADRSTWTAGDPTTGTWREACNEWGNLTIMGDAYISENATAGNTPSPNASNVATMEGLVAGFPGDTRVLYGGGNDNYDAGSIRYLSLRYGGRVIGLNNELNGISLGGIGRETDIDFLEIMNNVDDGVEVWGGTVNMSHLSVWNIGDDTIDIDQGYRGQIQSVLVVQGYSVDAPQGSGVGDNAFEIDGAEDSDWQPRTRGIVYNATVIGQPLDGDRLTAWRDGAGFQLRNCIFMDGGEAVVGFDNVDGDGGSGYGHNGSETWPQLWTTAATVFPIVNAPANPAAFYTAQLADGNVCEIRDSVLFRNLAGSAYTEFNARGQNAASQNNVIEPASSPIGSITRAATVVRGGKAMQNVISLDPTPRADALTPVAFAPSNGFLRSLAYRGAFGPGSNWLKNWTAADAFGFLAGDDNQDIGGGCPGVGGIPLQGFSGTLASGAPTTLSLSKGAPNAATAIAISVQRIDLPLFGCSLIPDVLNAGFVLAFATDATGSYNLTFPWPNSVTPGTPIYIQSLVNDTSAPGALFSFSNAVVGTAQ